MDATFLKLSPFTKRTILFVDTLCQNSGVEERISELCLLPFVVYDVSEVSDKEKCHNHGFAACPCSSMSICATFRWPPRFRASIRLSSVLLSALENNTVNPASAATTYDILLAENNLVNQKLALKIFEKYRHSIELTENVSLALQAFTHRALQNKPFDVILMDVSMPLMGGMEATQRDRERCLQAGMDDHITKPLRRVDLLNAINRLTAEAGGVSQPLLRKHRPAITYPDFP
ncbi:CheY-like superfamily [Mycena galericulata]|nr:CheY-like superfamily [Mycena galericulata]